MLQSREIKNDCILHLVMYFKYYLKKIYIYIFSSADIMQEKMWTLVAPRLSLETKSHNVSC